MFQKVKRKVDKALLKEFRSKICIVNKECFGEVSGHHIKSKGSGGGDVVGNLVPLCIKHHTEIHAIGQYTFMNKYDLEDK